MTAAAARTFKLQFSPKSGTCDAGFTGEGYGDVDTTSTVKFYNNLTPADGATYVIDGTNDPIRSGITQVGQYYEESYPMGMRTVVPANQDSFWDISLTTSPAAVVGTSYCFRVLYGLAGQFMMNGTYSVIPEITLIPPTLTQANSRFFANADTLAPGSPLTAQDTAPTVAPQTPFRLRQRIAVDTALASASTQNFKLQYAEKSGTCSASFSGTISYVNPPPTVGSETKTAGAGASNGLVGFQVWTNPGNIIADDGSSATSNSSGSATEYLVSSNHGFNIPSNVTITGIVVNAERSGGNESSVRLVKAGSVESYEGRIIRPFNTSEGSWGSPTDLWGSIWTPADINNSGFGVALSAISGGISFQAVDYISITVHYSDAPVQTMIAGAGANYNQGGSFPWTSTGNITADDSVYASASSGVVSSITQLLRSSNHGFSIPSNAIINGIKLTSELNFTGTPFGDSQISLTKSGIPLATSKNTYEPWTGLRSWGGESDTWGDTWTPSEINDTGFGAVMSGETDTNTSLYVDYMSLSVYYSEPSTEPIFFYNNPSVTSGATISSSGNDPTNSSRTATYESYHENDPFSNGFGIPLGNDGMWDFAISSNTSAAGKTYCFRTVKSDGTPLDTYSQYPEITFSGGGGGGPTLEQQTRGGQSVIDGIKNAFSW